MKIISLYPIISKSLRYLFTQRLRAISSLLGVLFGVVAVVAMLSIGEGAKREAIEQIHQLGINNIIIKQIQGSEDQPQQLTLDDYSKLKNTLSQIKTISPVTLVEATVHGRIKEMSPEILATTDSFASIYNIELEEGRFLTPYDLNHRQLNCVLGYDIARSLGKDGRVGKILRIENQLYTIVGVLQSRTYINNKSMPMSAHHLNQNIFIPIGTEKGFPRRSQKKQDALSEIIVQLSHEKDIVPTSHVIKRTLHLSHRGVEDYQIIIPQELIGQAQQTQRTFNLILGSIACISLLVGGIGIMNIMLATISERTREIGIRRAVGANKAHILLQFLFETLILTLSGALLGILVGILFSTLISFLAGWKTIITFWSLALSLLLATGVGVFAGLYPAIKASKLHPIDALRNL